jgi:hypothetical protein
MDRFACGHCGTEMLVQRRGGTVALRAVTEAIKKVEISTDKAAAEVALMRLEAEMRDLSDKAASVKKQKDDAVASGIGCAFLPVAIGLLLLFAIGSNSLGWIALMFGALVALGSWAGGSSKNQELEGLESRMKSTRRKIGEKRGIVEN